jgi:Arc/MetJ-type ribon-helix-helix transcriptional regulator
MLVAPRPSVIESEAGSQKSGVNKKTHVKNGVVRLTEAGAASTLGARIDGRKPGGLAMTIQLKPEQEHRIAEALRSGAYQSADDVIECALEVLHERDKWLMANRQAVDAKIRRGIEELNRGGGIPEDELDAHLEALKAQAE